MGWCLACNSFLHCGQTQPHALPSGTSVTNHNLSSFRPKGIFIALGLGDYLYLVPHAKYFSHQMLQWRQPSRRSHQKYPFFVCETCFEPVKTDPWVLLNHPCKGIIRVCTQNSPHYPSQLRMLQLCRACFCRGNDGNPVPNNHLQVIGSCHSRFWVIWTH